MSDSVRPHRGQPTRLPRPWGSPGKNTGVGCHFLLQCMKVKRESEVSQSCLTLSDPMDFNLPGSSAHGIFLARILEWGAIAFSISIFSSFILFQFAYVLFNNCFLIFIKFIDLFKEQSFKFIDYDFSVFNSIETYSYTLYPSFCLFCIQVSFFLVS